MKSLGLSSVLQVLCKYRLLVFCFLARKTFQWWLGSSSMAIINKGRWDATKGMVFIFFFLRRVLIIFYQLKWFWVLKKNVQQTLCSPRWDVGAGEWENFHWTWIGQGNRLGYEINHSLIDRGFPGCLPLLFLTFPREWGTKREENPSKVGIVQVRYQSRSSHRMHHQCWETQFTSQRVPDMWIRSQSFLELYLILPNYT